MGMEVLVKAETPIPRRSSLAAWACFLQSAKLALIIALSVVIVRAYLIEPGLKAFMGFSDHDLDQLSPVFLALAVALSLWVSLRRWQRGSCAAPPVKSRGRDQLK
jgi:hypothetical protein